MAHFFQQGSQRFAQRRDGIDDAWRRIREHGSIDDSTALQLPQMLCEGALADTRNATLQFGESFSTGKQLVEDSGAPSTAHNTGGRFHGASFRIFFHG